LPLKTGEYAVYGNRVKNATAIIRRAARAGALAGRD